MYDHFFVFWSVLFSFLFFSFFKNWEWERKNILNDFFLKGFKISNNHFSFAKAIISGIMEVFLVNVIYYSLYFNLFDLFISKRRIFLLSIIFKF